MNGSLWIGRSASAAALLAALACGGGNGGNGPGATGTVVVTVGTTGAVPDPDGYQATIVGGTAQPVGTNGSVSLSAGTGPHDVSLGGIAANCGADHESPQHLTITAGDTFHVAYAVSCPAPLAGPGILLRSGSAAWLPDTTEQLLLVDPSTGIGAPIGLTPVRSGGLMRLAPGRGRMAYVVSAAASSSQEVWVADIDGGNARAILADSGIKAWPLGWAPDGRQLAVWSGKNGGGVATVYADGGGFRFIGPRGQVIGGAPITRADWSPDGRSIAFVDAPAQFNIGITSYDPVTRVFRPLVLAGNRDLCCLRWSPDGQWLAFGRVMLADTLRPTSVSVLRVRSTGGPIDSVLTVGTLTGIGWSPQGDQLLLEIGVAPGFLSDLFVVDTNGTNLHNVTNTASVPEDGANWLP